MQYAIQWPDFYGDMKHIMFHTKAAVKVLKWAREMVIVGQSKIKVPKARMIIAATRFPVNLFYTSVFLARLIGVEKQLGLHYNNEWFFFLSFFG